MTTAGPLVDALDEDVRLAECAREPIHLPGAIQPHGALLVIDPESLEILQASENTADVLGVSAAELIGTGVGAMVGPDLQATLRAGLANGMSSGRNPLAARVQGRDFDVILRRTDDVGVVEFEPAHADSSGSGSLPLLHAALQRLAGNDRLGRTAHTGRPRSTPAHRFRPGDGLPLPRRRSR